jgi:hypothetical protein
LSIDTGSKLLSPKLYEMIRMLEMNVSKNKWSHLNIWQYKLAKTSLIYYSIDLYLCFICNHVHSLSFLSLVEIGFIQPIGRQLILQVRIVQVQVKPDLLCWHEKVNRHCLRFSPFFSFRKRNEWNVKKENAHIARIVWEKREGEIERRTDVWA